MSGIEDQHPHLNLEELLAADVVVRARYAISWGNGDALHGELIAEVEKLRGAIKAIKRKAEIGHSQTNITSDKRMMTCAHSRFSTILNIIKRIENH